MIKKVICQLCNQEIGDVHGYQIYSLKRNHYQKFHLLEFNEVKQAKEKYQELAKKYGVNIL